MSRNVEFIVYNENLRGDIYNPNDLDIKIIRIIRQTNGYDVRVRLNIDDKWYDGILEAGGSLRHLRDFHGGTEE